MAKKEIKLEDVIKVEVDEALLKEFIENMDILPESRKVAEEYEKELNRLEKRESHLRKQKDDLLEQQLKLMQEMEMFKDNVSEYIYSKKLYKENQHEIEIIDSLIDEMKEEYRELNFKYYRLFSEAEGKDRIHRDYNAEPLLRKVLAETLGVIALTAKEIKNQYYSIYPVIAEIKGDKDVLERFPRVRYIYNPDSYRVNFSGGNGYRGVDLTRNDIESACSGKIPDKFKKE